MDIVSQAEIAKILSLKVSPDRIVYANPCKQRSHIRYAAKHNVSLITFDNELELQKLRVEYPNARSVFACTAGLWQVSCCLSGVFGHAAFALFV